MLADCMSGDSRFGIIFRPEGVGEHELQPGHVGCVAQVDDARTLPDGRSNIVVHGVRRFSLERFVVTPSPYHVGEVSDYDDDDESPTELTPLADRVRGLFDRVGRAARTLADESDPLPPLPETPESLSFGIAALIDLEPERRQELLVSRSPAERLRQIDDVLSAAVGSLEARARVHRRAKGNGRGPHATA
jgi:Lon protease-like protein